MLVYALWAWVCRRSGMSIGHALGWGAAIAVAVAAGIDAWNLFYLGISRLESPLYARLALAGIHDPDHLGTRVLLQVVGALLVEADQVDLVVELAEQVVENPLHWSPREQKLLSQHGVPWGDAVPDPQNVPVQISPVVHGLRSSHTVAVDGVVPATQLPATHMSPAVQALKSHSTVASTGVGPGWQRPWVSQASPVRHGLPSSHTVPIGLGT